MTDRTALVAAYDDSQGVTAEFNRNVLRVLNARLGASFEPEAFEHVALFEEETSRIEMRLRAARHQSVHLTAAGLTVELAAGEEIRTEISTKFTRAGLERELEGAGMRVEAFMSDARGRFGLALAARS